MKILSARERSELCRTFIEYFQAKWANENSRMVYEDCIVSSLASDNPLPEWYLLTDDNERIAGCAGLITNDFISRMDLYPWCCALYVEDDMRGHGYGALLLERAKRDAANAGFSHVYLCTDHIGYYERYGFTHIGTGYHPWGESSRIYAAKTGSGETKGGSIKA